MRIKVNSGDTSIRISLPASFVLNKASLRYINKKAGFSLVKTENLRSLKKALRKFKKTHKDLPLVEIKSSGGDEITVSI